MKMNKKKIIRTIEKHLSFFAKPKCNNGYDLRTPVLVILTLTFLFMPINVKSVFVDTKHTIRYDGEVNIGKFLCLY